MKSEIIWAVMVAVILSISGVLFIARKERLRANAMESERIEAENRAARHSDLAEDFSKVNSCLKKAVQDRDAAIFEADEKIRQAAKALREAKEAREESRRTALEKTEPMQAVPPDPEKAALQDMVSAQEEAIRIRDAQIIDLKGQAHFAEVEAGQLRKALIEKDAQAAALQGQIKGALWKGRVQGFLIGVASDRGASLLIR